MAAIGQQLTVPESGWKRFDDTDTLISKIGTWTTYTFGSNNSNYHNNTQMYATGNGDYMLIKFYGTKIRFIQPKTANTGDIKFNLDGTDVQQVNTYGAGSFVMVYEKLGLEKGFHTLKIEKISGSQMVTDAIDIDEDGYLARPIGAPLITPDAGWKRFDDQDAFFSRDISSAWTLYSHASAYNGSYLYATKPSTDTKISFDFIGTKFRIIDVMHQNRGISKVTVDGVEYTYSSTDTSSGNFQRLVFELLDLPREKHTVTISYVTGTYISLDAIDIDSDGRLFHPDEVTDISQLEIGKRIRCNYVVSTASVVGVYSNLGKETDPLIPTSGSIPATHKGDFYFIMADEYNDKKILIADRNIQSFMTWDVLNNSGLVFGAPVDMKDERYGFVSRILSGGINSTDTDNEWYKYIVSSTLNNTIVAGDNSVWNWSSGSAYSWTSTTPSSNATYRMRRGLSAVNAANTPASNSSTATSGYKPVFEVKTLPMMKSFIHHDGSYKKYTELVSGGNSDGWSVISATLPSEDTFISDGMNDLSVLNRKNKDFVQAMSANGSLGSGKVLKGTIDLKKYFEITKLTVK